MRQYHIIIILTSITLFLNSCSSSNIYDEPITMYAENNEIILYDYESNDSVSISKWGIGEEVKVYGRKRVPFWGFFYVINYNQSKYLVRTNDLMYESELKIIDYGNEIILSRDKEDVYWSRAIEFVMRKSDMKVETQTDMIVDTFNPISKGSCGFRIVKSYVSKLEMKITSIANCKGWGDEERLSKECSYFIKNGEMP